MGKSADKAGGRRRPFHKVSPERTRPGAFVLYGEVRQPLGEFTEVNEVGLSVKFCIPVGQFRGIKGRRLKERANGNRRSNFRRKRQSKGELFVS